MAEKRKKTASILLTINGKKEALELTPATEWPRQGGQAGLFRVRRNGQWHQAGQKHSFLSPEATGALVAALIAGGEPPAPRRRPEGFDEPRRVSLPLPGATDDDLVRHTGGWTLTPPHLGPDGRWYVWVRVFSGKKLVPVEELVIHPR